MELLFICVYDFIFGILAARIPKNTLQSKTESVEGGERKEESKKKKKKVSKEGKRRY